MNIREGAFRIKRAGQILVLVPTIVFAVIWLIYFIFRKFLQPGISDFANTQIYLLTVQLIALNMFFLVPGIILWFAGWIVDGFAKDGH